MTARLVRYDRRSTRHRRCFPELRKHLTNWGIIVPIPNVRVKQDPRFSGPRRRRLLLLSRRLLWRDFGTGLAGFGEPDGDGLLAALDLFARAAAFELSAL